MRGRRGGGTVFIATYLQNVFHAIVMSKQFVFVKVYANTRPQIEPQLGDSFPEKQLKILASDLC